MDIQVSVDEALLSSIVRCQRDPAVLAVSDRRSILDSVVVECVELPMACPMWSWRWIYIYLNCNGTCSSGLAL